MVGTRVHFARETGPGLRLFLEGRLWILIRRIGESLSGHSHVPFVDAEAKGAAAKVAPAPMIRLRDIEPWDLSSIHISLNAPGQQIGSPNVSNGGIGV